MTEPCEGVAEREKWEADLRLREREFALKERAQNSTERELRLKAAEQSRAQWTNPLFLALSAAALAALGNAAVAFINGSAQRELEATKAVAEQELEARRGEAARILEVIRTNDPDKGATNLKFLADVGLIRDPDRRTAILDYLQKRNPGEGAALPSATDYSEPTSLPEYICPASLKSAEIEDVVKLSLGSEFAVQSSQPGGTKFELQLQAGSRSVGTIDFAPVPGALGATLWVDVGGRSPRDSSRDFVQPGANWVALASAALRNLKCRPNQAKRPNSIPGQVAR